MNPQLLVVAPDTRSAPLNVIGLAVTVLVSKDVSNAQQITLQSGAEGSGPPHPTAIPGMSRSM
jgi:hypothetical protein